MDRSQLREGLRVHATSGVMKGRTGSVESFGEMQTLAGTTRSVVIVKFDEPPISFGCNVEWLEPLPEA